MIGYLQGELLEISDSRFLIGVGAPGGGRVGYDVWIPSRIEYIQKEAGGSLDLFIHTHVREDSLDLYGFLSSGEREVFLTLLSVNGIGPKVALGILSHAEPAKLLSSILEKNKDFLTQIPGVGKKTVERLILELSDPIRKKMEQGRYGQMDLLSRSRPSGAEAGQNRGAPSSFIRDAKIALVGLGYRENELSTILERVFEETAPKKVEDLIRATLKELATSGGASV